MAGYVEIKISNPEGTSQTSFHPVESLDVGNQTMIVVAAEVGQTTDLEQLVDWERFQQDLAENGTLSLDEVKARYGL